METTWAFGGSGADEAVEDRKAAPSVAATAENIDKAIEFLDGRRSLGWTDLDKTFAAMLERAGDNTQVIYVGDGVPSAGDADPQALVATAAAAVRRAATRDVSCRGAWATSSRRRC